MINSLSNFVFRLLAVGMLLTSPVSADETPPLNSHAPQGIVKPRALAVLRFPLGGRIDKVNITDGTKVRAGELLAVIDDRVPQARVEAAKVEANQTASADESRLGMELAEKQYQRLKEAFDRKASSQFEMDERRMVADQAKSIFAREQAKLEISAMSLRMAEAELDRYQLRAPFDGEIIQVHAKVGNTVDPTNPIVTLVDLTQLETELHLPISLFGQIAVGSRLSLEAAAPVNHEIQGEVLAVSPLINSASRTFRCLLAIDNSHHSLPAGFTVRLVQLKPTSQSVSLSPAP